MNCMYCGAEIAEGSTFCSKCGKKQVQIYTQTFRRENLSEEEFIAQINNWFASYPQVANVKGKFLTHQGTGLFVNKYVLDAFSIEYELFSGVNDNQYGVINLSTTGIVKSSTDELLARWLQSNPGAQILAREGGVNQRGQTGSLILSSGFGAVNKTQLYVFFKFNRATGTGVPHP
ncbi:MAG: zinc ribbon domain-containing protein [Ruminococcaceae bacterium]|nr:zinc ribbon domain-containing protein [Oscillospiraceae bacterium]